MKIKIMMFSLILIWITSGMTVLAAEPEVSENGIQMLSQSDIPVCEAGILVQSDKIYSGQYDGQQKGVLRLENAKLKYYADGKFQSAFSGKLSGDERDGLDYSYVDFYVKNGIVDTGFQGVVNGKYVVNGIISSDVFESDPDSLIHSWCSRATGLSIRNTAEGVSVGYDRNRYGDDRGFYIYRLCHETGEFVFFSKMDGDSTGFVDQNVERGHTYTYYIWTYSLYSMWNGSGYICGFVDASIVYGGNDSGKINTFESFSAPDDPEAKDLTWQLSDEGVLTIFGNGSMPDYDRNNNNEAPWSDRKDEIKSVVVTDGITSIGKEAFFECWYLEHVELASSVEVIGTAAFYRCLSLQTVELGEGLRVIMDYAFEETISLTTIRLPASLGNISTIAFCKAGLKSYEVAEGSAYMVRDGVLFNAAGTILLSYPCELENETYSIPSNVAVIEKAAFQYAKVKAVDIPDGVKKIKMSAFSLSKLENLVIPDSVTEAGEFAVYKCQSLKELQLGSGLKSLPYRFAESCTSLETLSFSEGLEEIDMRAFGYCSALKRVALPSSVEIIAGEAFGACTLLENVIFGEGLKRIEARAFYGTVLSRVDLPDSLNYIGSGAFPAECSLNFSEDSKLIDFGGYYQCGYQAQIEAEYNYDMAFQVLEQVNQKREENGLGTLKMDEELLDAAMLRAAEISIYFSHDRPSGQSCFTVNSKAIAENIAAGNNTAISVMDSWMNSTGHRENILGEDHKGLGIGCVVVNGTYYWVQLFSRTETDTEADENSRQNFSEVTSVLFDKDGAAGEGFSVSAVHNKIEKEDKTNILVRFYNGYRYTPLYSESISYTSLDPSVVTVSPEGEVTGVAEGVAEVTACLTNEPEICGTVTITVGNFSTEKPESEEEKTITIQKGTSHIVDAYKYQITGASTVSMTGISDTKTTKVKVPKKVTIEGKVFNVTAIGKNAFKKNTKIKNVEIGDNVTTIGASAFEGCTKLTKVTVGKGVTEIGGSAFKNCKKLGTITIKSGSLKKVGKNALKRIKATAKVKVPSKKLSDYKKLFKNKGQGKKVRITK